MVVQSVLSLERQARDEEQIAALLRENDEARLIAAHAASMSHSVDLVVRAVDTQAELLKVLEEEREQRHWTEGQETATSAAAGVPSIADLEDTAAAAAAAAEGEPNQSSSYAAAGANATTSSSPADSGDSIGSRAADGWRWQHIDHVDMGGDISRISSGSTWASGKGGPGEGVAEAIPPPPAPPVQQQQPPRERRRSRERTASPTTARPGSSGSLAESFELTAAKVRAEAVATKDMWHAIEHYNSRTHLSISIDGAADNTTLQHQQHEQQATHDATAPPPSTPATPVRAQPTVASTSFDGIGGSGHIVVASLLCAVGGAILSILLQYCWRTMSTLRILLLCGLWLCWSFIIWKLRQSVRSIIGIGQQQQQQRRSTGGSGSDEYPSMLVLATAAAVTVWSYCWVLLPLVG
jgi:hypothetical protein